MIRNDLWPFWFFIFGGLVLAYLMQLNLFVNNDVYYLMRLTNSILAGGKYGVDIFETNPPMILYLYLPPVLFTKWTGFAIEPVLRLYVLGLAALSLSASLYYLRKLIQDRFTLDVVFITLILVSVIIQSIQFAQREHLFIILFAPYVFASACTLSNIKINRSLSFMTGLAAGLGCCMKPYFLIPLILIELYQIIYFRRLFAWVRIETITILSVLIIYLATAFYFQPKYFTIVLPLINQFYFLGIKQDWGVIFIFPHVLYCIAIPVISFFAIKHSNQRQLTTVLVLTSVGMTLVFLVTKTMWFYHTLPALAFCAILAAYLLAEYCKPVDPVSFTLFIISSFFLFYIPISVCYQYTASKIFVVERQKRQDLINLLAMQPGRHSIVSFSVTTTADCYPLNYVIGSKHESRYPFFWWIRGALKQKNNPEAQPQINQFMEDVAADLEHYQSRWIVINQDMVHELVGNNFNFFTYFSANPHLKSVLQRYHFWKSVAYYDIYELQ